MNTVLSSRSSQKRDSACGQRDRKIGWEEKIVRSVPEIIASGGVVGLVYQDQWVGALLIALAVILWRTALRLEHRS